MRTFKLEVQEFLAKIVEIKANDINEAFAIIKDKYEKTEIVLNYNDFVEVRFIDINSQDEKTEKIKLINDIINYLYEDEKKHYEELGKPDNHIFYKIEKLKKLNF